MSLEIERNKVGRKPFQAVKLSLDRCQHDYGLSPCTAGIDEPFSGKCFKTFQTCQDTPNYSASSTIGEVWLTESTNDFPLNLLNEVGLAVAVPCIEKIKITPPVIDTKGGLGVRSTVSVKAIDFPHHDRGLDPYVDTRNYNPEERGTFWGKLLARNKHYNGRLLTVYTGFLDENDQFDATNFEQRVYVIETIDGPSSKGIVNIKAKDILKLADDKRAKIPIASTGSNTLALDAVETTSITLTAGTGDEYTIGGGYVRLEEEIIQYASRTGDVLSTLTRGTWGTIATDHDAGVTAQLCADFSAVNVVDIVEDLLLNYTSIPAGYLDTVNWDIEKTAWLSSNNLTNIISKPTGVFKILQQLTAENLFYMWWDAVTQKVKLKAIAPSFGIETLTDNNNIVEDSMKIEQKKEQRISQVWFYYGVRDYTETKTENYKTLYITVNSETESPNSYGESVVKIIESRWIIDEGLALQNAGRLILMFKDNQRVATFNLDKKDNVKVGDRVTLQTRSVQTITGEPESLEMILTEEDEIKSGTTVRFKAAEYQFTERYGNIAPNMITLDYSADTDENRGKYAYICLDNGKFADNSAGYAIL